MKFTVTAGVTGAFGAFGYGVSLRAGRLGRWYCAEHRPGARPAPRSHDVRRKG